MASSASRPAPSGFATYARMDQAQESDWRWIQEGAFDAQTRVADTILGMLENLRGLTLGHQVDQLSHALQTAARAEADGADDELVVAALCHDLGKQVSVFGHSHISAAILRPFVRDEVFWIVDNHQIIQAQYYAEHFGKDPSAFEALADQPHFAAARHFVEAWDQCAFEADLTVPSLGHFEARVRSVFAEATTNRRLRDARGE